MLEEGEANEEEEAANKREPQKRAFAHFKSPESPLLWFLWLGSQLLALDSPLCPLNTSILEDLAILPLVYFMKMKRQKSCKINSFLCTNILQTSSYEMVEEMVFSIV